MPETGWKSPGTCASVARSGGSFHWQSPDNAKVDDGNYTWCYGPSSNGDYTTHWLRCTNFGFTAGDLPENAIIVGIKVSYDCYYSVGGGPYGTNYCRDSSLRLRKSTGQVGDDKAVTGTDWPAGSGSSTYLYRGGDADDWNAGLSRDDILSSSFGVDLSAKLHLESADGIDPYVDVVRVRIYYVLPMTQPIYFWGDPNVVYGRGGYLLGNPALQAQYWGYLFGNLLGQSPKKAYIMGNVATAWGKAGFLIGAINPHYGSAGYLVGTLTAIPYYPKPAAGSWFQRTGAIIKNIS